MENSNGGSINPSDVATLSLLGGRGGYGYGGGGYGGYGGQFANDASNAVRINAGRELASSQHDFISQQVSDNADRNRDITTNIQLNTSFERMADKITDQTRFFAGEVNMLGREQTANAREAAKCCCEAKLLAVENQAKTDAGLAQILANQACDTRVEDAVANAQQNAKLDIILAENGRHRN